MRIRQVMVVGVVWPALALVVPSLASACYVCNQFLQCVELTPGAKLCINNAYSCSMLLPCAGGAGDRFPDGPEEGVTAWSLFDAEGATTPVFAPERGPLSVGELARSLAGPRAGLGALADVALAFGTDFAVTLANDAGDGFALRRIETGARVRLEVREVVNEAPGRVLADQILGPRDALAVPIVVAGRARVLVLQAERVPRVGGGPEMSRLRRALAEAGRPLPVPAQPLLKARAQ